jgi:hypothetical protein
MEMVVSFRQISKHNKSDNIEGKEKNHLHGKMLIKSLNKTHKQISPRPQTHQYHHVKEFVVGGFGEQLFEVPATE